MAEKERTRGPGPWIVVTLLSLAFVLNYIDRQVVFTIFPLLRRELSLSDAQLGLAGSLFTWTYSLLMPISGRIADLVPRQRMVIVSVALWSLATLGTASSHSATQFLWWRIAMGSSESLYMPAAIAMITTAHPGATRSRALAILGFAQFTGITLGGWYGGWAAEHLGWRLGFGVLAATGLLYSGFLRRELRGLNSTIPDVIKQRSAPRDLLHSSCYITLSVAFLTFCAMLWMLYAWLPNFIYENFRLSLAESGLTATFYLQISSAAGVLMGGVVGDYSSTRHSNGRFFVVISGLFLCAPFACGIFLASSLSILKASACGFGLLGGFFMANVFSAPYDVVAPRNFGLATGLLNLFGGLGGGAAILLVAIFQRSFAISGLMLFPAVSAMTMALVLLFVVRSSFERERLLASAPSMLGITSN